MRVRSIFTTTVPCQRQRMWRNGSSSVSAADARLGVLQIVQARDGVGPVLSHVANETSTAANHSFQACIVWFIFGIGRYHECGSNSSVVLFFVWE